MSVTAKWTLVGALLICLAVGGALAIWSKRDRTPVVVGVLHSQTGALADSERLIAYGSLLAVEELNRRGGLLGRPLKAVQGDGATDWPTFAREAERLIDQEEVDLLIGCYTSASRKEVKQVVEAKDHLLIYPMPYEGVEESPNVFCMGATPNQQIIPAVNWTVENLGARKFVLIGSDYIWPRVVNAIVGDQLAAQGIEVVGEHYVHLGATGSSDAGIAHAADAIVAANPDMIINTLVGDGMEKFVRAMRERSGQQDEIPMLAFAMTEVEAKQMPPDILSGHYTAWNYFQELEGEQNAQLVKRFKERWPEIEAVNDGMISAYHSLMLWAQAVEEAGTVDVKNVRRQLRWQSIDTPGGILSVDSKTRHAWRVTHIGRFAEDGTVTPVWTSGRPVRPLPFPMSRTRIAWERLVQKYHADWDGWANPVDPFSNNQGGSN